MSILSERLREARERKNLKQVQVKERTGINNKTLSGYEKGVSEPDAETVRVLADLYEVSIDWLYGRTDNLEYPVDDGEFITDEEALRIVKIIKKLPQDKQKIVQRIIESLIE